MQSTTLTNYRAANLDLLLGITRDEARDYSSQGIAAIHNLLRARLKAMARLGERRHWAYCPIIHQNLYEAFKRERIAYERMHPITLLRAEAANSSDAQQLAVA